MFDSYGHKYKYTFAIQQPDDSKTEQRTDFIIYSTYPLGGREYNENWDYDSNRNNVVTIITNRGKHLKGDPVINEMKLRIRDFFRWGSRGLRSAPNKWKIAFVTPDKNMALMIEKGETYYNFMGQRTKKTNMLNALSRFINTSCYEKDPTKLLQYVMKLITIPENVSYVLENRTPYWFYDKESRKKIECRLNTKLISATSAALEISDGIWAPIEIDDLDIMVNHYYHEQSRSKKWSLLSPKKLWTMLMGNEPSPSQLKLMVHFLQQNRTQDIVEERAIELMNSLEVKYPDRIKILNIEKDDFDYQIMLVRGKIVDWVIMNSKNASNHGTQRVKTFAFISNDLLEYEKNKKPDSPGFRRRNGLNNVNTGLGGVIRGPICIDNMHRNSSLGDQYASRALALLNDIITIKLVYTIDRYLPNSVLDGKLQSRFSIKWEDIDKEHWGGYLI